MMLKNVKMPIVAGGGSGNRHSLKSALKRGFTIMELVIVIAVIAVLAAVLIPTFANLTQRANESADTQTVKNLNTILSSEEVLGNKAENMTEAIEIASSGGYNVTALTPTSDGNDILWNQDTNRFVLADSETGELVYADEQVDNPEISVTGSNYTYWKIADSDTDVEDGKYSYYLSDSFADNDITVTTGIDVGENTDINITYQTTASQSVIFNTNGGTLTIDAANSDVKHYGTAEATNITAVKGKSYELYGTVDSVSITQGRVYVAESGYAALVEVSENAATVIVDATSSENIGDIVNNASSGSVTVADEVKDNVLNSSVIEASKDFAGGYGTEANPFMVANLEQWTKLSSLTGEVFVKLAGNIEAYNEQNSSISRLHIQPGTDMNLDLSGYEIKAANNTTISITGEFTLEDSVGTGRIYSATPYRTTKLRGGIIQVSGSGVFNLNSGLIYAVFDDAVNDGQFGIVLLNSATFNMYGGKVEVGWYAVSGNGNNTGDTTTVNIYDGELVSSVDFAIYNPQGTDYAATVNIYGGYVDGAAGAVSMNRGTLNISGGQLSSRGSGNTGNWGDGTGGDGNAILSLTAKYGNVKVSITGGEFDINGDASFFGFSSTIKNNIDVSMIKSVYDIIDEAEQATLDATINGNEVTFSKTVS